MLCGVHGISLSLMGLCNVNINEHNYDLYHQLDDIYLLEYHKLSKTFLFILFYIYEKIFYFFLLISLFFSRTSEKRNNSKTFVKSLTVFEVV